jgi:hypothetical protein
MPANYFTRRGVPNFARWCRVCILGVVFCVEYVSYIGRILGSIVKGVVGGLAVAMVLMVLLTEGGAIGSGGDGLFGAGFSG